MALAAPGALYSVAHFAINTNTAQLISPDIGWRKDEIAYGRPSRSSSDLIVAVIDGPSAEAADAGADRLAGAAVEARRRQGDRPGLAAGQQFLPRSRGAAAARQARTRPDADRNHRAKGLSRRARRRSEPARRDEPDRRRDGEGGFSDRGRFEQFVEPLGKLADAIDAALAGKPKPLSWRNLFEKGPPAREDLRRLVLVEPVLDFSALEPGARAIARVRGDAVAQGLTAANGFDVRLTGQTPLADEEFATVAENYEINLTGTVLAIAVVLFLALRSGRIILAVLITLLVGLVITFGLGLLLVHRLNLISVAFAVLFIGLGVDFGIQFSTRYREERFTSARRYRRRPCRGDRRHRLFADARRNLAGGGLLLLSADANFAECPNSASSPASA